MLEKLIRLCYNGRSMELDERQKTGNDKIFVTKPLAIDDEQLEKDIKAISDLKPDEVRDYLKRLVPNYKHK